MESTKIAPIPLANRIEDSDARRGFIERAELLYGKGPYLQSNTLRDPWGHAFQYDANGLQRAATGDGSTLPDIYCTAPDGRIFGNWNK